MDTAPSLIEYKLRQATSTLKVKTVSDKLNIINQVFPNIYGLKSEVEKKRTKGSCPELNLSWETVAGEYKRYKTNKGKNGHFG